MDNPELYSRANSMQRRDNELVIAKYWDRFDWSERDDILDFGCGDGDTTRRLLVDRIPRFMRLVGVDISEEMIDFAQRHNGNPRLEFRVLDIADDAQVDAMVPPTFDKIFSFYCVHWVRHQRKLMESLHKMAKAGSQLLLLFAGYHPFATVWERMAQGTRWSEYMKDVKNFMSIYHHVSKPAETFSEICCSAGFQVVECEEFETSYTYQSAQHANDALVAVSPFISRIPADLLDSYIADQLSEFQKEMSPAGSGGMTIHYRLTCAYLRKN
nr:farnesoic acid O-methyltransferase [Diaphanosoma celebensis]